ncbi:hypothetical protein AN286_10045 [Aliarcobacter cryaerophilus ATCC 43158]|uniref:Uncharacterized protein n=1 Tax=Aliarcobacter cryaerophilus ATCC 43158 TaxID=1032070 RepID=A0AAD0TU39_9BACT|nr:hypothetical protein [Aliarcobacter cryaerophilus]AYJ80508.1 hypothetical protein ACRYA_1388 [Aliarcobacter cryaerophilus ATCC 43158]PRM96241.1 hypothetical protein CJ667_08100 [Aliarcobacter cryaerophilus]QCZ24721.1 hypothetical protein AN286_10045 [Aliarcobacter cryaerophilus ATCC 43158]
MSKIIMNQKELEEILDNYDYKKSLFISELRKLNEGNIKNIEDLKVLTSKFTDFNSNLKSLKEIETEIIKISQFSKNIDVSEFQSKLKSIVNNSALKLERENTELQIQTKHLNNNVQNLKEVIPQAEEHIRNLLVKAKQKLQEEINITSKFLRFQTLLATFIGGFFVGALLLFLYHIFYMQKNNEYISFFLMGNDKEFVKAQIDKAPSFLAGYNSNKDLIIKIYNKENK